MRRGSSGAVNDIRGAALQARATAAVWCGSPIRSPLFHRTASVCSLWWRMRSTERSRAPAIPSLAQAIDAGLLAYLGVLRTRNATAAFNYESSCP